MDILSKEEVVEEMEEKEKEELEGQSSKVSEGASQSSHPATPVAGDKKTEEMKQWWKSVASGVTRGGQRGACAPGPHLGVQN